MIVAAGLEGHAWSLEFPAGDTIGTRIVATGGAPYELEMLLFLRSLLAGLPGIVVDVGAHVGNHSAFFARVLGREVLAIEADPELVGLLARNVAGLPVEVHHAAAWDRSGARMGVFRPHTTNTGLAHVTTGDDVGTATVDELVGARQVACIKLDVEGSELRALVGALGVLRRSRPVLAVECRSPNEYARVRRLLPSYRVLDRFNPTPTYVLVHRGSAAPLAPVAVVR